MNLGSQLQLEAQGGTRWIDGPYVAAVGEVP